MPPVAPPADGSLPLVLKAAAAFAPATEWELLTIDEAAAVVIIAGGDDVPAQLLSLLASAPQLVALPMLITGDPSEVRAALRGAAARGAVRTCPDPTRARRAQARSIKALVTALEPPPAEVHVDDSSGSADNAAAASWVGLMLSALALDDRPVAFVTSRSIADRVLDSARSMDSAR
eukprot:121060-Prymnesium_polylepis.1